MVFTIAAHQMLVLFLIMAVGYVAAKTGIFGYEGMAHLAGLLTKVLFPIFIFYNTYTGATRQTILDNLAMAGLTLVFYVVIALVTLVIAKLMRLPHDRDRAFQLTFCFGNIGFVGIPLIVKLFPETGMLYAAMWTLVDTVVFWTYGVFLSTGRDRQVRFTAKSLLTPNVIAILLAFVAIFAQIPLPEVVLEVTGDITQATPELAMMYLGMMLCFSEWRGSLLRPELYVGVLVKMVALPVLAGRALLAAGFPYEMVGTLVIGMGLPTAVVATIVSSVNSNEGAYVGGMTAATLVICLATLPLVVLLTLG